MAGWLGCWDEGSFHGTRVAIITVLIHHVRQQPVDVGFCLLELVLGHGHQAVSDIVGKGCSSCDGLLLGIGEVLEDGARLNNSIL